MSRAGSDPYTWLFITMRARLLLLLIGLRGISSQRPTLSLDEITTTTSPSISYSIPANNLTPLSLTFALCSLSSGTSPPRISITNTGNEDSQPNTNHDSQVVNFEHGLAAFSSHFMLGGILTIDNPSGLSLEIGLSSSSPIHQTNPSLPVLGDTTSSQAILFSYPVVPFTTKYPFNPTIPSFPNYTFPAANMSQPPLPQDAAISNNNVSLVILPTSSSSSDIPQTGCYLSSQSSAGTLASSSLWARDSSGFRFQYFISGLSPQTNYTAFLVNSSTSTTRSISGPIYFTTKSSSFPCTLTHSLPFCPSITYAIPLDAPPVPPASLNFSSYTSENLPSSITSPLLSYFANFTTVLSTFPCGREAYSPIVTCTDCELEYRKWLCSISFPRCSEPPPSLSPSWSPAPPDPSATGIPPQQNPLSLQHPSPPLPALLPLTPPNSHPRNPFFPTTNLSQSTSTTYAVLPCIEQCYAVDRSCPPFLKFKCPSARSNAGFSYALGYIDKIGSDGRHAGSKGKGKGRTGEAQDRWGNVWCLML